MASLIFGAVYLGHHAVVGHRREKQRVKNYERWEGLRDEYDEQKRTQRETRSLDLQRTGQYDDGYQEKPILTLRDQQEADDARTSWRPQETFTPMHTGAVQGQQTGSNIYQPPRGRPQSMDLGHMRAVSDMNGYSQHNATGLGIQPQSTGYQPTQMRPLPAQNTGAWDDSLPRPIRLNRYNENNSGNASPNAGVARTSSLREYGSRGPPASMTPRSPYAGSSESLSVPKRNNSSRSPSIPEERIQDVEPMQYTVPGGMMAELIEGSQGSAQQRNTSAPLPVSSSSVVPMTAPAPRPAQANMGLGERDMDEWWKQKGTGTTPAAEKDMQEWWR